MKGIIKLICFKHFVFAIFKNMQLISTKLRMIPI